MSAQISQPINKKRLIQEFLLKGRNKAHDFRAINTNETSIDTNKSSLYFPTIQNSHQQTKHIVNSSSQNLSNTNIEVQNKLSNYYVPGDVFNQQKSRRFIKLKNNKSVSSQQNISFSPFLQERDSLGNLLKDQNGINQSERYIQHKLRQHQSNIQLTKTTSHNKNTILPYSGQTFENSSIESESQNMSSSNKNLNSFFVKRKNTGQKIESFKDKYTQFVVRLNILDNKSYNISDVLKTDNTDYTVDRSINQDSSPLQFQSFTLMNSIKQYGLKQKTVSTNDMLSVNSSLMKKNISKNQVDNHQLSNRQHYSVKNIHLAQQVNPPVGCYHPNYSLIQKNSQSHLIQPITQTNRSYQKKNDSEILYQSQSPRHQQDFKKKLQNQENDENYEKLFNKMMREIKKQVDLEQQQNQGNLLHPDGDKELKKVMSSEEMENFSNQYKKQMGDMKNIFNRIKSSLNQNKLNNVPS